MVNFRTVREIYGEGKRVLVRCDFNVPLDEEGNILDDFRIRSTVPTIEFLLRKHASIVLLSHLGDPGGKIHEHLRLTPVAIRLVELLGREVEKAPDCVGKEIEDMVRNMKAGDIILLENLRFHKGEEENDSDFAEALSRLGEIYVNDAFGVCHRSHASVVGLPKLLPAYAGLLLEKEIRMLDGALENPARPFAAIIGGKKVETKAKMIQRFAEFADWVFIGNLIAKEINERGIEILHPSKVFFPPDGIEENGSALDIGPKTIRLFSEKILQAKTILWSGPLGKIEEERFQKGTKAIADAIVKSGAFSVAGGGETVEFINKIGLIDKFSHASTGGGAMLAYVSGEKLPGLEALENPKS